VGPFLNASEPVELDIPSIEVHSTHLEALTVGADGALTAPQDFATPGWYTGGPTPGQLGPAVIGGHVDSTKGPAVFYRLGQLQPRATIVVIRRDHTAATFLVDRVARYPKAAFPTQTVYGTTTPPEIRLITCGGAFDATTGHYVDNIVAFGHLGMSSP